MKLTLRTMLAYMDDGLDEADAKELGKKIDESEFASKLVYRIRSAMRKLRLGAPKLLGKGIGLDANTVAEYLEATLSPDRVADFEKVCLESDVHLAEAAACHQILTLLAVAPVHVEPALRERVYQIGRPVAARPQSETAAASTTASSPPAPPTTAPSPDGAAKSPAATEKKTARPKPEVPDYLKAGSRPWFVPFAVSAAIVLVVLTVAFFALGGPGRFLAQPNADDTENNETPPTDDGKTAPPAGATSPNGATTPDDKSGDKTNVVTPPNGIGIDDADGKPDGTDKTPDDGTDKGLPDPPEPGPSPVVKPDDKPGAPDGDKPDDEPSPVEPSDKPDKVDADKVPEGTVVVPPEPKAVGLGRLISVRQVLARMDSKAGTWFRLPINSTITSADRVLALPNYEPQIALATGLQLTLVGPAELQAHPLLADDTPDVEIKYGRALIVMFGKAGARMALRMGERRGVATFVDADSAMAVEVVPYLPPGTDPEKVAAKPVVNIWATNGQIEWAERDVTVPLAENQALTFYGNEGQPVSVSEMPKWITHRGPVDIDKTAAEGLEAAIDTERPLLVSLEERVEDFSVEVRMLAARSLMYLDRFDPFVLKLEQPENKSFWHNHFNAARESLARRPESAKRMREAFERVRSDDGPELFRILWGYSPDQLAGGADNVLVDYLSHDDMDFRVLAFFELWRITGMTQGYRPERNVKQSTATINSWRARQKENRIVYKDPPVPPILAEPPAPPPAESTGTDKSP